MAATEQSFPATGSVVPSSPGVIISPFQFVADPDTFLRVTSVCSVAGVTVALQGRRVDSDGNLLTIQETHAPNSNRTVKTQDYAFGNGAIQNLTVFASAGAPLKGQCYVMVQILRNVGAAGIVLGTLLGGYITAVQALGFPGSPVVSSTDGEPAVRNIYGTTPAPGVDIFESVPTGARWELVTFYAALTAAAGGSSRVPFLRPLQAGANRFGNYGADGTTPGATNEYTWAQNLAFFLASPINFAQSPIAQRQFLLAGDALATLTSNLGPTDQWFLIKYQVREWLEVG